MLAHVGVLHFRLSPLPMCNIRKEAQDGSSVWGPWHPRESLGWSSSLWSGSALGKQIRDRRLSFSNSFRVCVCVSSSVINNKQMFRKCQNKNNFSIKTLCRKQAGLTRWVQSGELICLNVFSLHWEGQQSFPREQLSVRPKDTVHYDFQAFPFAVPQGPRIFPCSE